MDQTYNTIDWQTLFTWLWKWLWRLSKRQSPTSFFSELPSPRWSYILDELLNLLVSNHLLEHYNHNCLHFYYLYCNFWIRYDHNGKWIALRARHPFGVASHTITSLLSLNGVNRSHYIASYIFQSDLPLSTQDIQSYHTKFICDLKNVVSYQREESSS